MLRLLFHVAESCAAIPSTQGFQHAGLFYSGACDRGNAGHYDPWLVALSYLVATGSSFLALILARYICTARKPGRKRLLIWSGR
jgi:hypothetical protein